MKKSFAAFACALLVCACSKYDDSAIWNEIDQINQNVSDIKTDIESMRSKIDGLNAAYRALTQLINGGLITGVTEVTSPDGRTGYTFTVTTIVDPDANPVQTTTNTYTIYNGSDGAAGAAGETPVLSVAFDQQAGRYYWVITVNGVQTELTDGQGNRIYASGVDGNNGANGNDGADGLTPQLKIEEEQDAEGNTQSCWYVGYDLNGDGTISADEWTRLGVFGGNMVSNNVSVSVNEDSVTITVGDEEYTFSIVAKNTLGITFDAEVASGVHMFVDEVREFRYTLTGASENAIVKAEFQNEGGFKVKTDAEKITVTAGNWREAAVVIVSVYDNGSCYHTHFTITVDVPTFRKLDLPASAYYSPYTCTYDGGGIPALIDGNETTFWHSDWAYLDQMPPTGEYGIYIDIDLEESKTEVAFRYRTRETNANAAPTALLIGVSNDNENWEEVGIVTSGLPDSANTWWEGAETRFSNNGNEFRYVRFGMTHRAGDVDLTNKTLADGSQDCVNLSELEVYAK